jgi:TDG/mug DNA glycosylase family protein
MPTPVLPDLLAPGLRLVICGSAAGTVSAMRGAYYAHPQNRFWPILAATGLTPRRFAPEEYPALLDLRIGLTDIAKFVFGADSTLPRGSSDPVALGERLRATRPALLAFNGKRAAEAFLGRPLPYGPVDPPPGLPPIHVLPSTSPLAVRFWSPDPWFAMAAAVAAGGPA